MGLRIQNNIEAFNTHRQLTATAFSTGWYGTSKKRGVCRNALLCVRPMKP